MLIPTPVVEPGPPGWKPEILTARQRKQSQQIEYFNIH